MHVGALNKGRKSEKSIGCDKCQKYGTEKIHGENSKNSKIYGIWSAIKYRCFNPNSPAFRNYGGRGISIYDPWKDNYVAFRDYILETLGPRPDGMSIDRVDNNKGYEPGNLKWSSDSEQNRNRRDRKLLRFNGREVTMAELSEISGVAFHTLYKRIESGMPPEQAAINIRIKPGKKRAIIAAAVAAIILASPLNNSAKAQVIVEDPAAIAHLATTIENNLEQLRSLAIQIQHLAQMTDLAVVAGTVLGDSVSPEMTGIFGDLQNTYGVLNRTYGSVMRVPAQVDQDLALFEGLDQLSFPELVARARRLRQLTAGTSSASLANSADIIEMRARIAAQQARANGMADRSVSALSATQAAAQQLRVVSQQLDMVERNTASIDASIALRQAEEAAQVEMRKVMRDRDTAAMNALIEGGPGSMTSNPIAWGR